MVSVFLGHSIKYKPLISEESLVEVELSGVKIMDELIKKIYIG